MVSSILNDVDRYYSEKLNTHGATPKGVDWNSSESQEVRFDQLLKIVDHTKDFSILDYGCGYGALAGYLLQKKLPKFDYTGVDISKAMLRSAAELYQQQSNINFVEQLSELKTTDYVVASGIFNVKLQHSDASWYDYILEQLDLLAKHAKIGFSFNCLTSYSDAEYMRADLYYADSCQLFDHCKRTYSRNVALLHDYNLYEFTIHVRL